MKNKLRFSTKLLSICLIVLSLLLFGYTEMELKGFVRKKESLLKIKKEQNEKIKLLHAEHSDKKDELKRIEKNFSDKKETFKNIEKIEKQPLSNIDINELNNFKIHFITPLEKSPITEEINNFTNEFPSAFAPETDEGIDKKNIDVLFYLNKNYIEKITSEKILKYNNTLFQTKGILNYLQRKKSAEVWQFILSTNMDNSTLISKEAILNEFNQEAFPLLKLKQYVIARLEYLEDLLKLTPDRGMDYNLLKKEKELFGISSINEVLYKEDQREFVSTTNYIFSMLQDSIANNYSYFDYSKIQKDFIFEGIKYSICGVVGDTASPFVIEIKQDSTSVLAYYDREGNVTTVINPTSAETFFIQDGTVDTLTNKWAKTAEYAYKYFLQ